MNYSSPGSSSFMLAMIWLQDIWLFWPYSFSISPSNQKMDGSHLEGDFGDCHPTSLDNFHFFKFYSNYTFIAHKHTWVEGLLIIPSFLIISHPCLSSVCTAMCSAMRSSLLHTSSSARLEKTCQHTTDNAICLRHTDTDGTGDGMDLCSRMLIKRLACCCHLRISTQTTC